MSLPRNKVVRPRGERRTNLAPRNVVCCSSEPRCPGCPAAATPRCAPTGDAATSLGSRTEGAGKRRVGRVLALLIAASAMAGCQPRSMDQPPTVRFGDEACDECRMIIGDDRFAAALVTPAGDALKFDDIGCLVEHEANRLRPEVAYWVCDSQTGRWLNARKAVFEHSSSVASPMGYGLAARAAGAGLSGRTLRFEELPGFLTEQARMLASGEPKAEAASTPPSSPRNEP